MTKRGHFIINGIPRVIINQIIRQSGVYCQQSIQKLIKSNKMQLERRFFVDLISHRGTWLRLELDKRKKIWARMKKVPRIPALLLLQAIGLNKKIILENIFNLSGSTNGQTDLTNSLGNLMRESNKKKTNFSEVSYKLIRRRFLNPKSYDLGKRGRFQLNQKFGLATSQKQTTLTPYDLLFSIDLLMKLFNNQIFFDDIDHLQNRRIRTSGELIQNQINLGLIRLEKKIVEKLKKSKGGLKLQHVFTSKPLNSVFKEFFGTNPLSQFLDQANPLAELTHKRRLTSVGPGGINRDTAGMAIRGIHSTHYGRICPIETPEGQNAGLVNSVTTFASLNRNGFIKTPFFLIYKGQLQKKLGAKILSSEFEKPYSVILNNIKFSPLKFLPNQPLAAGKQESFKKLYRRYIDFSIVSTFQLMSVATSLIPFLEHNDANRALMGSNMQRQAVPLLHPERPLVGTGLENRVLFFCSNFVQAENCGLILYKSHNNIQILNFLNHKLFLSIFKEKKVSFKVAKKFKIRCFNSYPIDYLCFKLGRKKRLIPFYFIKKFYKFKKQIYSRKLVSLENNKKVSLIKHVYARSQQSGLIIKKERKNQYFLKQRNFFETINVSKTNLSLINYLRSNQGTCLIQKPISQNNRWIERGDLITDNFSSDKRELALGKNVNVAYLSWQGYNFEDALLINESLIFKDVYTSLHIEKYKIECRETPFGLEQITKRISESDYPKLSKLDKRGIIQLGSCVKEGDILVGRITPIRQRNLLPHEKLLYDIVGKEVSSVRDTSLRVPKGVEGRVIDIQLNEIKNIFQNQINIKIKSVCVLILEYKKIKVGDKIAGRHGNKGIVSKILNQEDMPYYPDGKPVEMILNPLGVPSRMNVGQIFESLFGFISKKTQKKFKLYPFDEAFGYEASRSLTFSKLYETRLKLKQNWLFSPTYPAKFRMFDGRTGTVFNYPVMAGVSYMMKLIHLVDEKIHARSTGAYSLVTQQPLRGRSKHGGQRFGEMEVWALEGFGVAYTLQELLTVKSDDIKGRMQIMETIFKNKSLQFGTPESFKVLIRELQALCLDVQIYNKTLKKSRNFQK